MRTLAMCQQCDRLVNAGLYVSRKGKLKLTPRGSAVRILLPRKASHEVVWVAMLAAAERIEAGESLPHLTYGTRTVQ